MANHLRFDKIVAVATLLAEGRDTRTIARTAGVSIPAIHKYVDLLGLATMEAQNEVRQVERSEAAGATLRVALPASDPDQTRDEWFDGSDVATIEIGTDGVARDNLDTSSDAERDWIDLARYSREATRADALASLSEFEHIHGVQVSPVLRVACLRQHKTYKQASRFISFAVGWHNVVSPGVLGGWTPQRWVATILAMECCVSGVSMPRAWKAGACVALAGIPAARPRHARELRLLRALPLS